MRDSLRLLEERERLREARLAALKSELEEGLASGPGEPIDMDEIKQAARARRKLPKASTSRAP